MCAGGQDYVTKLYVYMNTEYMYYILLHYVHMLHSTCKIHIMYTCLAILEPTT